MGNAAMAVIKGVTEPVDVMAIQVRSRHTSGPNFMKPVSTKLLNKIPQKFTLLQLAPHLSFAWQRNWLNRRFCSTAL